MAQTQTVTDEGITELCKLCAGEAASAITGICCLNDDVSTCTASTSSTYASPADAKITDSGLLQTDADTVSTSGSPVDTIEVDHVFTATGTKIVSGFLISNDEDDVNVMECCLNALLEMTSSDTLTINAQITMDQA